MTKARHKECKQCGAIKPLADFYTGRKLCKLCQSVKYKKPQQRLADDIAGEIGLLMKEWK